MTQVVLIHGTWLGGWAWERLVPALTDTGHDVHAPDLPGLAGRASEAGLDTGLDTHIRSITAYLDEHDLHEAILVGHSYGGLVAQGAAAASERVAGVVYLDAFLAAEGESAFDLLPWLANAFQPVDDAHPWLVTPLDPAGLGVTDPTDAAWLTAHMTPMPLATHRDPAPAPDATPAHYVYCEALPLMEGMLATADARGYSVTRIPTAHMPMVTHPDLLAATLATVITRLEASS
ncbi:alpha/beta hydrolase [Herbiconiux moechotypicola]|uniref:Alpha/beta fold hydrolase n=1 Tax=Herbiconiux moechotypicola TaxID=637393 RepID=A0ABN3D9H9_9MICO|nr:alpha/beta hydrolase [Herbiconiux moechotypicola]MCS5728159.1 alpha/beta hydrolase [Herbiconiux moechotypicola]